MIITSICVLKNAFLIHFFTTATCHEKEHLFVAIFLASFNCKFFSMNHSRIIESRQSCELNPNKIESATEACANAEFLLQVLDDITESIFMSSEACPRTLR